MPVYKTCTFRGRQDLFDRIESDIEKFKETLSTRVFQNLRIVLEIGYDVKGLTKKGKKRANLGHRVFRSLDKLERFLGLKTFSTGLISGGRGEGIAPLDWTKKGLCKYKKRANISVYELRGERVIGIKILKKYILTS